MTIVSLLLFLLVLVILYVVVTKFLPPTIQQIALAIIGVVAVIYLITQLWPGLASFRISK